MKKYFIYSSILVMSACASESSTPEISTESENTTTENTEEIPVVEETVIAEPIALKEKSQVNDYAEYFLQAKIVKNSDELNFEKGINDYYQVLDIANGYAVVSGGYEGEHIFVVWRMANGNDLVGKTTSSCGPVCDYNTNFYEITSDGDKDVTETILPKSEIESHRKKMEDKIVKDGTVESIDDSQLFYVLPQKGTSIEVYLSVNANDYEFPIATLTWDKSKFSIGKKYNEITMGN